MTVPLACTFPCRHATTPPLGADGCLALQRLCAASALKTCHGHGAPGCAPLQASSAAHPSLTVVGPHHAMWKLMLDPHEHCCSAELKANL